MPLNYLVKMGAKRPFSFTMEGVQATGVIYFDDLDSYLRPKMVVTEIRLSSWVHGIASEVDFDRSDEDHYILKQNLIRHLTWLCQENDWILWDC